MDREGTQRDRDGKGLGDLPARVAFAVPALAVAITATALGGWAFAVAAALVAVLAVAEGMRLLRAGGPVVPAAGLGAAALALVVVSEGRAALAPAIAGAAALVLLAAARTAPDGARGRAAAAGVLCLVWVGGGLAHGVLLRELPHGAALVLAVLLGTFVGDSAAHIGGTLLGRRPLAPRISPNKTVEGLLLGICFATGSVTVFAIAFHDAWFPARDALALGLAVGVAAPLGDLWESALKRDAGAKDSGSLLGPHGGLLDRVDAVLFTAPAGFYVALALL